MRVTKNPYGNGPYAGAYGGPPPGAVPFGAARGAAPVDSAGEEDEDMGYSLFDNEIAQPM